MDNFTIIYDSKGRISAFEDKNEKGKIVFEYKNNILGTTDEPNVVMTVTDEDERSVYNLFLNKDGFAKHCDGITYEKDEAPKIEAWDFEYNSDNQLAKAVQSKGGYKTTFTIVYNDGNAVESSTVSEKEGKETDHYRIFYTSKKVTSPIENKGCLMMFEVALGIEIDKLSNAYYAGMLGKATKHLPIYNLNIDNERTSFEWTLNKDGFPIKAALKNEDGEGSATIVW
ncbi:DUF4595 domain-containing protein [Prevotella falsenii]